MALQKSFTTNYGIPATYWKVGPFKCDFHSKTCSVKMLGFVNKQARDEDMQNISFKDYTFNGAGFTFDIEQKIIAQFYVKIKALEIWSGATDV